MQSCKLFINGAKSDIRIQIAKTFFNSFWGLMGKRDIPQYGLLIKKCSGVHTFFMHFSIDVIFLDFENRVIKIKRNLPPWRMTIPLLSARNILEIPTKLTGASLIKLNDSLSFEEK